MRGNKEPYPAKSYISLKFSQVTKMRNEYLEVALWVVLAGWVKDQNGPGRVEPYTNFHLFFFFF